MKDMRGFWLVLLTALTLSIGVTGASITQALAEDAKTAPAAGKEVGGYTKKDGTKVKGYTRKKKEAAEAPAKDAKAADATTKAASTPSNDAAASSEKKDDVVHVKGYTKKDGTKVAGYTRKKSK